MKKIFRNLGFLTLIVATILATRTTTSSSTTQQGPSPIDPACVSACIVLLAECISSGEKNNCLGVYRKCVAHCKN
jgi:hypothetical protein